MEIIFSIFLNKSYQKIKMFFFLSDKKFYKLNLLILDLVSAELKACGLFYGCLTSLCQTIGKYFIFSTWPSQLRQMAEILPIRPNTNRSIKLSTKHPWIRAQYFKSISDHQETVFQMYIILLFKEKVSLWCNQVYS